MACFFILGHFRFFPLILGSPLIGCFLYASIYDNDFNMPGGAVTAPVGGIDAVRIEAPVTFKAYLMCAFAAFGGIFFGYDSGYVNGVIGMDYFISTFENLVSPCS